MRIGYMLMSHDFSLSELFREQVTKLMYKLRNKLNNDNIRIKLSMHLTNESNVDLKKIKCQIKGPPESGLVSSQLHRLRF